MARAGPPNLGGSSTRYVANARLLLPHILFCPRAHLPASIRSCCCSSMVFLFLFLFFFVFFLGGGLCLPSLCNLMVCACVHGCHVHTATDGGVNDGGGHDGGGGGVPPLSNRIASVTATWRSFQTAGLRSCLKEVTELLKSTDISPLLSSNRRGQRVTACKRKRVPLNTAFGHHLWGCHSSYVAIPLRCQFVQAESELQYVGAIIIHSPQSTAYANNIRQL